MLRGVAKVLKLVQGDRWLGLNDHPRELRVSLCSLPTGEKLKFSAEKG